MCIQNCLSLYSCCGHFARAQYLACSNQSDCTVVLQDPLQAESYHGLMCLQTSAQPIATELWSLYRSMQCVQIYVGMMLLHAVLDKLQVLPFSISISNSQSVYLFAGSRSSALTLAVAMHPRARITTCIDERSLGFWALGHASATG